MGVFYVKIINRQQRRTQDSETNVFNSCLNKILLNKDCFCFRQSCDNSYREDGPLDNETVSILKYTFCLFIFLRKIVILIASCETCLSESFEVFFNIFLPIVEEL